KQWYRVGIQIVGAIVCMFSVIFIVPRKGIVGAAWTLFAVDLWTVFAYWIVSRHFASSVVSLRKLVVPGIVLVVILLIASYCPCISVWYKLAIFIFAWSCCVLLALNFKDEVWGIAKTMIKSWQKRKA
ncbi:MAG: hypothetical protein KAI59_02645, partial [Planctomycetes bacterium]|nr:hypothetical protein [Planctomycetota bacterium]